MCTNVENFETFSRLLSHDVLAVERNYVVKLGNLIMQSIDDDDSFV
jgi:hypothetical protein